jgi:hypothetical protein
MPEGKNQGETEECGVSRRGLITVVDLFVEGWNRKLWDLKNEEKNCEKGKYMLRKSLGM